MEAFNPAPEAAAQGADLTPPAQDPDVQAWVDAAEADDAELEAELAGLPNLKPKPTAVDLDLIASGEKLIDRDALRVLEQRRSQEDLKVLLGACARLLDELEA